MNNNYQYMNMSKIQDRQMQHSFAKFPPQSSIMSVEEQSPQQLTQSKIQLIENIEPFDDNSCKSSKQHNGHYRMSSWQFQKSSQIQSTCKSQYASPIKQYIQQPQNYSQQFCPCELEQLWQEFLEIKLIQRQLRIQQQQNQCCCHLKRGCNQPY